MKFLCLTLLVVLVFSASAQQVNEVNFGDILGGFMNTATSNMQNQVADGQNNCMTSAFDLLNFLYQELQLFLASGEVPDQMSLMMKGMVAMTKFTSAKEACLS